MRLRPGQRAQVTGMRTDHRESRVVRGEVAVVLVPDPDGGLMPAPEVSLDTPAGAVVILQTPEAAQVCFVDADEVSR